MTVRTALTAGLVAALFTLPATLPALADDMSAHSGHAMNGADASTKGFEAANMTMHKAMAIPYTGNADVDFVRSMIPHHQGAIDMAKVELAHGKDPAIRKIAEDVIAAQEAEIAVMKAWLAKHGQ
ncbi:protein of unknown function [Rhizobium sp. RU35A]|uniref:CopM family metallochaperone n=1 Tax=Rhizobium sp. RU35A TaxID=1907414 RepID=UPI0009548B15|nr:DUF305 domain-containing protein [Rhizobium sp. RU35A]SIP99828.1 protein of unknown function [Rhizobium sp. RU35A]